ncbi:ZmpA/ZmpB/ZmpC family metallo-endopeptidase, partial [Streptococcus pneumoniae]|uniref:ZmpA/ZmpB/ZmpC family metallo-endopeptidase n=1 Tax=Streptococcus pneumoniae TaxID=1313 RepID=UPI000B16B5C2
AALLLGLTYLNRYYGVKFGDVNIKELMLFKPDFYGEKVSVLDRLIEIGSKENNIKGSRTFDAFGQVLAKYTKSGNLDAFLNYNRQLFTAERLGKKSLEDIKDIVNKAADGYRNYYDFWYRLASDNVKQRLLRDAVIPIWEGYNAPGGWVEKYGRYNTDKVYTPLREFFG